MLILSDAILKYFDIIFIFEEAGPCRARRGAGTSPFGAYFSKKVFSLPTAPLQPREQHAVIRLVT